MKESVNGVVSLGDNGQKGWDGRGGSALCCGWVAFENRWFTGFRTTYRELVSWIYIWGFGSRLQAMETAAELVLECLKRGCRGVGNWEMVPISYGAWEKGIERSGMTDVPLVQPLVSSCPGIRKLAEAGEVTVNQPIVDSVQRPREAGIAC